MAISKKKVESFKLIFKSEDTFEFIDLLQNKQLDNTVRVKGKDISYKILEDHKDYLIGLVETSRSHNIPPKKSSKSRKIGAIGLLSDEGLAYANVFIYEKKRAILLYEVNKFGCFVDHFLEFIYRSFRKHEIFKGFTIRLDPILKANEYQRMLKMPFHKSIELQVANPDLMIKDYKHKNDAIWNLLNTGNQIHSSKIKTKFEVNIKDNVSGLASQSVQTLVDRALEFFRGPAGDNVKKIIVEGYEKDSDDAKLSTIDLIADRYLKHIELNEPRENVDLLENQRSQKIKQLYLDSRPDFDAIFGK